MREKTDFEIMTEIWKYFWQNVFICLKINFGNFWALGCDWTSYYELFWTLCNWFCNFLRHIWFDMNFSPWLVGWNCFEIETRIEFRKFYFLKLDEMLVWKLGTSGNDLWDVENGFHGIHAPVLVGFDGNKNWKCLLIFEFAETRIVNWKKWEHLNRLLNFGMMFRGVVLYYKVLGNVWIFFQNFINEFNRVLNQNAQAGQKWSWFGSLNLWW